MKTNTIRFSLIGLLVVGLLPLGPSQASASHEPLAVYDDWTTDPTIRGDRWEGRSTPHQGFRRELDSGAVEMRLRRQGNRTSNSGFNAANNRLVSTNSAAIDHMEADVLVHSVTAMGCAANSATRVRAAQLNINAFNDGSSPAAGDMTGDHFGRVHLNREASPARVLTVQAFVLRCQNANCSNAIVVNSNTSAGTVPVGQPATLRLLFDAPNSRFVAGAGANPDVVVAYDPALNAAPPGNPFADVRTEVVAANCTAAPTETNVETSIGTIRTNASAVIP